MFFLADEGAHFLCLAFSFLSYYNYIFAILSGGGKKGVCFVVVDFLND